VRLNGEQHCASHCAAAWTWASSGRAAAPWSRDAMKVAAYPKLLYRADAVLAAAAKQAPAHCASLRLSGGAHRTVEHARTPRLSTLRREQLDDGDATPMRGKCRRLPSRPRQPRPRRRRRPTTFWILGPRPPALHVCRCSVPEGRGSLVISPRRRREGGSPHATTGGSQSTGELTSHHQG